MIVFMNFVKNYIKKRLNILTKSNNTKILNILTKK